MSGSNIVDSAVSIMLQERKSEIESIQLEQIFPILKKTFRSKD